LGSINIFAGGFGSGKTEIALNFAMDNHAETQDVVLADLDLVNPYFVSRHIQAELNAHGVKLMAPEGELSFGDIPQLPAHLLSEVQRDNHLLIDVAGEDAGGAVIGYLHRHLRERDPLHLWLVINPFRPFAQDLNEIIELVKLFENASRLPFTGIISNPHMAEETTLDIIRSGHQQVLDYSRALHLEVGWLTVREEFYEQLVPEYGSLLRTIKLYTRPLWLQED
jgi:hypothetical protein